MRKIILIIALVALFLALTVGVAFAQINVTPQLFDTMLTSYRELPHYKAENSLLVQSSNNLKQQIAQKDIIIVTMRDEADMCREQKSFDNIVLESQVKEIKGLQKVVRRTKICAVVVTAFEAILSFMIIYKVK